MVRFAQAGDRFEPAEDFLDALTLALTDLIARMTSGPLIDDSGGLASKVWGDLVIAQLLNQFLAVVALIGAEGYSMPAGIFSTSAMAACGSARPVAWVTQPWTAMPLRFSISTWPA